MIVLAHKAGRRMILVGLAFLAVGFGSTRAEAQATPRSGVSGLVLRGPTRPVCDAERSCDEPAPKMTLLFRHGQRLYRATSGLDGRFRLALPPGLYTVSMLHRPGIGRGIEPATVRVPAGRFVRVTFKYDTGIR